MTNSEPDTILLEELTKLEQELALRIQQRMEPLLHPEFVEFGRSGTRYNRADVMNRFADNPLPAIRYWNFDLKILAEGVALLTYLSADADGTRQSLRSSIWVRTETGWQIRFHQGTAAG